jgi:CubicO group peptidase (beta-lactamase class C family)
MEKTTTALIDRADTLLRKAVEAGDIPGVVAMATDRERTLYEGAFGRRVLGQGALMSADTVVWLASMTKPLTGAAVMQQVERGKLDLESPASKWLPALDSVKVLEGFDAAGQPRLRAPKRPITLRHLLTHTAGYGYETWNAEIGRFQQAAGTPSASTGRIAALGTPLLFDPGERWNYGINIDWACRIVEAVSGKKLGAYLKENLFAPLGMNDTAFKITPAMRARLAKLHQRGDDGALVPIDLEVPQEPEFEGGGGGLYSTAGDYLKFVRMILNRGKANDQQVLKPETVDLMARNHMGNTRVTMLKSAIPQRSNDAEFFPGMPKGWGLSFQINNETAPTGRAAGGLMWGGLSNCYFWIDPATGVGGVYLTQILPFCDRKSLPLYYEFEKTVYQTLN